MESLRWFLDKIYLLKINIKHLLINKTSKIFYCIKSVYPIIKLHKHTILTTCLLFITIFLLFYCRSYLKYYQEQIEYNTIKDIQQAFIKYIKENSSWQLAEIIRNKNTSLINESEYVYNLDQQLDIMFSRYIYYELCTDGISLITNTYNDSNALGLKYNFTLAQDIKCTLAISKNPNSQYFKSIELESIKILTFINTIFAVLIMCILVLLQNSIKNTKFFIQKDRSLNKLLNYIKAKKRNTVKFNNYYISKQFKLFSTPLLIDYDDNNEGKDKVDLNSLESEIKQYIEGYEIFVENPIDLKVYIKDSNYLNIHFDKQVFDQLILSITCNIIHFIKNNKGAELTIYFSKSSVKFNYIKSFPVNEDVLKINSDPVIVNEFFEPFILGFSSIFDILNKLRLEYNIEHKQGINIIEISLKQKELNKKIKKPLGKIIDITKILKKNEI